MVRVNELLQLSPIDFERFCGQLLEHMGFSIEYTKHTGDGGIDIVAINSEPFTKGKYVIQCKRYSGNVGEPCVRDLFGVVTAERANKGILISTSGFTQDALRFAIDKPLELIDGNTLERIAHNHPIDVKAPLLDVNNSKVGLIIAERMPFTVNTDKYLKLQNACKRHGYDMKSVACLAYMLFSTAIEPDYGDSSLRLSDRQLLLEESYRVMNFFHWSSPQRIKDKNLAYYDCVCLLMKANICFLLGKYDEAKHIYSMILEWNDATQAESTNNGLIDLLWDILYSMCTFYSAIGDKSMAAHWLDHPIMNNLLNKKRTIFIQNYTNRVSAHYYSSEDAYCKKHKRELDHLDNIISKPYFCPVDSIEEIFSGPPAYDPLLRRYRVPVSTIRFPVFNGDYIVTGSSAKGPTIFFKCETSDGSHTMSLIFGR